MQQTVPEPTLIRVDASHGFLARRTTELRLRANGTLEAFNASNEGQAGSVITAVAKLALGVATGLPVAAVGSALPFDCAPWAKEALAERQRVQELVNGLEAIAAAGDAAPSVTSELARQRAQLQQLDDRLTLTTSARPLDPKRGESSGSLHIAAIDLKSFFAASTPTGQLELEAFLARQPGSQGFLASWTADADMLAALSPGQVQRLPARATPYLFYRRPIPAAVTVVPCGAPVSSGGSACAPDQRQEARALKATGSVVLPQLSGIFYLPIGRGGLFGSEEAAAEFDANGAPTRLKYGSDSGAAAIAGVINTGRESANLLAGADAAEEAAYLAELKRRKEIRELEAELAQPLPAS